MAHEFKSEDLERALGQVIHAAGDDDSRPILATVLFEGDAKGFRLAAADNYRIAVATLSYEDHQDFGRVPVAREYIPTLRAFLKIRKRVVSLKVARDRLVVTAPDGAVECRVVDGAYPNYASVIPPDGPVFGVNPAYLIAIMPVRIV